jgi:hypothetical protein
MKFLIISFLFFNFREIEREEENTLGEEDADV